VTNLLVSNLLGFVLDEVDRQDAIHPAGYPATRDGIRFGIATLQDELGETYDAWRQERRTDGWNKTEEELLQVIGVAFRLFRELRAANG